MKLKRGGPRKHNMARHPAYDVWRAMRYRCEDQNDPSWENYGGRGITVCPEWSTDFLTFWRDMEDGYRRGLTLERIKNDEGYCKANCRWATRTEQQRNRRSNILIKTQWGVICLTEAAERSGIGFSTIKNRMRYGWPEEKLLIKPDAQNRFAASLKHVGTKGQYA